MGNINSQGQQDGAGTPQEGGNTEAFWAITEDGEWVLVVPKSVDSDTVRANTVDFGVDLSDTGGGGGGSGSAAPAHGNALAAPLAAMGLGEQRQHPASPIHQAQPPQPYIPFEDGNVVLGNSFASLEDGQGTATVPSNPNDSVSTTQVAGICLPHFALLCQQHPCVFAPGFFSEDESMD